VDGRTRDPVTLRDLAQALSALAIEEDSFTIEIQRPAADVTSFEAGAPHAGADPLEIRLRSSSAMAPMITTMALPKGPPVSICSRKLTNSILSRFSSSRTSRKCFTERAIRSEAQTKTTSKRPRRASRISSSSPGRRAFAPEIRSTYSCTIS